MSTIHTAGIVEGFCFTYEDWKRFNKASNYKYEDYAIYDGYEVNPNFVILGEWICGGRSDEGISYASPVEDCISTWENDCVDPDRNSPLWEPADWLPIVDQVCSNYVPNKAQYYFVNLWN